MKRTCRHGRDSLPHDPACPVCAAHLRNPGIFDEPVPEGVHLPKGRAFRREPCQYRGAVLERTCCPLSDRYECDRGEGEVQLGGRCQTCRKYDPNTTGLRRLRLENRQSPGDVLVMTAAVEMLHEQYPGEFLTEITSPCPAIWENNPHVSELERDDPTIEPIIMEYPLVNRSDAEPRHFLEAYVEFLGGAVGKPLRLTRKTPALYLSDDEKSWTPQVHELAGPVRYWIINNGWKDCYTAKWWPGYQDVVQALQGRVQFVQVGELAPGHHHPPLGNVIDLRGKTDARQLIRLAYHAAGAIGPTTFLQHVMAALDKPYVCLLGGREPVSWVQYPLQATLHAVGSLDCCRYRACWKSRTIPLGDGKNDSLCTQPVAIADHHAPQCMTLIMPAEVVAAVERYEKGAA